MSSRYRSCGMTVLLLALACHAPAPPPTSAAPPPIVLNFDHLQHLTRNATVSGKLVRVVALYANAPGHHRARQPTLSCAHRFTAQHANARTAEYAEAEQCERRGFGDGCFRAGCRDHYVVDAKRFVEPRIVRIAGESKNDRTRTVIECEAEFVSVFAASAAAIAYIWVAIAKGCIIVRISTGCRRIDSVQSGSTVAL